MEFIKNFFNQYQFQLLVTLAAAIFTPLVKLVIKKIIRKYGRRTQIKELRTRLILKYLTNLINILVFILLVTVWGVTPEWIFASFASVFAIVGVAFFAQWSLLSNVTAGFIIYFTVPFWIGDTIKIIDKDTPIVAMVEDIKAFYIILKTTDGEHITFPNNLILQKAISIVKRGE